MERIRINKTDKIKERRAENAAWKEGKARVKGTENRKEMIKREYEGEN
jgi:hypothetical protein